MTDEDIYLKKKFGRKINTEKDGYTEVDYDGIARPVLKIPTTTPKGRRRLTAVYTDERQKINKSSLNRTIVIYGSKCYVHCPTIYQPTNLEQITLEANLFSNNRPVPAGNAKFKVTNKTVSKEKIKVTQGHVEETHNLKFKKNSYYECHYEGSEKYKISQGVGQGDIIIYTDTRIPLVVYVAKVITNKNEEVKLVARVVKRIHGNVIDYPDDIPASGKITFYIDGEKQGKTVNIEQNGFATIDYTTTHDIGVHTITAIYTPDTSEMKQLYQTTSGANTLFIGDDTNKPKLTQIGTNCATKNEVFVLHYTVNRQITGKIRAYIDGIMLNANECTSNGTTTFMGNFQTIYEQEVENVTTFKFTITIPSNTSWAYGGNHNVMLQIIEPEEELGDMEYWYFQKNIYIQHSTRVYLDNTFMDNTNDDGVYTGNNMYINENNSITHYKPTENQIPHSITVGNPLKIHVEREESNEKVTSGSVKVTITTRKKETWVDD